MPNLDLGQKCLQRLSADASKLFTHYTILAVNHDGGDQTVQVDLHLCCLHRKKSLCDVIII